MSKSRVTKVDSVASLSEYVEISRQFLRSVRLDADLGREDALHGYVCQHTTRSLLENMAKQINTTKQRAFTWTGPYGGGKSSLALVLCSLVGGNKKVRQKALELLDLPSDSEAISAFSSDDNGWLVLPVVGRRESIVSAIDDAIQAASDTNKTRKTRTRIPKTSEVISHLVREADARKHSGVLLVIDELGKFLESAAQTGDDVYFYQELAEAASRCQGKLVVVGILHQSFEQYAARLGREARDEWAKVQGRFIDIPLVSATDEVIELVSRAITFKKKFVHADSAGIVAPIVDAIKRRRPGAPKNLSEGLFRCWPLHPVTATLLGPISKRRFGQNERSTFGFLASREPIGFTEFLESQEAHPLSMYGPARYWDYLKANLEPAILVSSDGHRWAAGAEAVERAEARGNALHAKLVKTIALIDLFRNGSGLAAETGVLVHSVENVAQEVVQAALVELEGWSIIIFRKHLDAWGIYSGSDFDIDAAVVKARTEVDTGNLKRVSDLSDLYPVIAKRLYQQKGTMRWFSRSIMTSADVEGYVSRFQSSPGSCGEFILVLPSKEDSKKSIRTLIAKVSAENENGALIIGLPSNAHRLVELGIELTALEHVRRHRPELEGDNVARREVDARITLTKSELEEQLRDAFSLASWFYDSSELQIDARKGLSAIASHVAQEIFWAAPYIASELVNRDHVSSNGKAAQRDLMHRMVNNADEKNLGYEGYPADAGLFYTVVQAAGLHRDVGGKWRFTAPADDLRGRTFDSLWNATTAALSILDRTTRLDELYALWSAPPFGIRAGVMPILALAYFLANRQHLAMYIEGVFCPELTDANVDEWLQDQKRIGFRYVQIGSHRKDVLEGLSEALTGRLGRAIAPDPLDSARGLVALAFELPMWARKTDTVSSTAKEVRALLLKAHDPHKVLFNDLPALFSNADGMVLVEKVVLVIEELSGAYLKMLRSVEARMIRALDHEGTHESLQHRGASIRGVTGDFMIDALAARLSTYDGSAEAIEGLISLAISKPTKDCNDRDIDAAILKLGAWAMEFRRAETLASLQGRPSNRHAIGVVFGDGHGHSVANTFDVAESDAPIIADLVKRILSATQLKSLKREVILAALAEVGAHIVEQSVKETQP